MRVLIAEDDPPSRLIHRMTVEQLGHECVAAENGNEAWEIFRGSEVDVVLSNWMMPDVDGIELCRRVRNADRAAYTYFILLTALGEKEHLLKGMNAGADDYLTKPLDADELQVRLISASRVTSLHRQLAEKTLGLQELNLRLERLNIKLFEQARRDPLTRLANRLQLREDLEMMRGRVERYGHGYSAVLLDIDFFKAYNDRYGHMAGDDVLMKVAGTVAQHCRLGDTAYRYGGEEFLIVLPEQSGESATAAAERMRRAVEELSIPHEAKTPPGPLTISAGVAALSPEEEKSVEALLREADAALYNAKRSGRNRVAVHEPGRDG